MSLKRPDGRVGKDAKKDLLVECRRDDENKGGRESRHEKNDGEDEALHALGSSGEERMNKKAAKVSRDLLVLLFLNREPTECTRPRTW